MSFVNGDQNYLTPFKKHEYILNNKNETFENKIESLIDVWKSLGELDLSQFDLRHVIQIMDWAKLHALNIVLTAEWNNFKETYQSKLLDEIGKAQKELFKLNNAFATRCKKLADVVKNPWEDTVLMKLMKTRDAEIGKDEIEFFCVETAYLVSVRLKKLCESHCEDLALNLVTAFMNCNKLSKTQDFNLNATDTQMWFIFDIYIALLYKFQERQKIVVLLKELSFEEGLQLVRRFAKKRVKISKIWKNCHRVAILASQMYISQAVVKYTDDLKEFLENYLEIYVSLCNTEALLQDFSTSIRRISNLADAAGLYVLCAVIQRKAGLMLKPFVIEMYIRALTTDMNELERQKDANEVEKVALTTSRLAAAFCNLAAFLDEHVKVARECVLTAFSLEPTKERLENIETLAKRSGFVVLDTGQDWKCKLHPPILPSDEITWMCPECGEWMSKPEFNVPIKINMALNEALQTSVLGISEALCDDLVVCLSNPRYQILSWFLPWEELHRLCLMYLQDPQATKNIVTELKFVDIDYSIFKGIKREPHDEMEGIERGYEQYLDQDFVSDEDSSSSNSEDSMSQDSRPYSLGSDGAGEGPYLPMLPAQTKSDPNTLKSLRMFRPNLKRAREKETGEGTPEKIFKSNLDIAHTVTSDSVDPPEVESKTPTGMEFISKVTPKYSAIQYPKPHLSAGSSMNNACDTDFSSKNVKTATLPLLGGQVAKKENTLIQVNSKQLSSPQETEIPSPFNNPLHNKTKKIKKNLPHKIRNKSSQNGSKENNNRPNYKGQDFRLPSLDLSGYTKNPVTSTKPLNLVVSLPRTEHNQLQVILNKETSNREVTPQQLKQKPQAPPQSKTSPLPRRTLDQSLAQNYPSKKLTSHTDTSQGLLKTSIMNRIMLRLNQSRKSFCNQQLEKLPISQLFPQVQELSIPLVRNLTNQSNTQAFSQQQSNSSLSRQVVEKKVKTNSTQKRLANTRKQQPVSTLRIHLTKFDQFNQEADPKLSVKQKQKQHKIKGSSNIPLITNHVSNQENSPNSSYLCHSRQKSNQILLQQQKTSPDTLANLTLQSLQTNRPSNKNEAQVKKLSGNYFNLSPKKEQQKAVRRQEQSIPRSLITQENIYSKNCPQENLPQINSTPPSPVPLKSDISSHQSVPSPQVSTSMSAIPHKSNSLPLVPIPPKSNNILQVPTPPSNKTSRLQTTSKSKVSRTPTTKIKKARTTTRKRPRTLRQKPFSKSQKPKIPNSNNLQTPVPLSTSNQLLQSPSTQTPVTKQEVSPASCSAQAPVIQQEASPVSCSAQVLPVSKQETSTASLFEPVTPLSKQDVQTVPTLQQASPVSCSVQTAPVTKLEASALVTKSVSPVQVVPVNNQPVSCVVPATVHSPNQESLKELVQKPVKKLAIPKPQLTNQVQNSTPKACNQKQNQMNSKENLQRCTPHNAQQPKQNLQSTTVQKENRNVEENTQISQSISRNLLHSSCCNSPKAPNLCPSLDKLPTSQANPKYPVSRNPDEPMVVNKNRILQQPHPAPNPTQTRVNTESKKPISLDKPPSREPVLISLDNQLQPQQVSSIRTSQELTKVQCRPVYQTPKSSCNSLGIIANKSDSMEGNNDETKYVEIGIFADFNEPDEFILEDIRYTELSDGEFLKDDGPEEKLPKNINLTGNIRTYSNKSRNLIKNEDCVRTLTGVNILDMCKNVNSKNSTEHLHSIVQNSPTNSKESKELKIILCRLPQTKRFEGKSAPNKEDYPSIKQKCDRGKTPPKNSRRRKSLDKSENKVGKAPNLVQNHNLSPLQDVNLRVNSQIKSKVCCDYKPVTLENIKEGGVPENKKGFKKTVFSNVPGLHDFQMMRPANSNPVVNVVQVSGGRSTQSVSIQNTQTSTQVTPHIQRIGQPRVSDQKPEHSNSLTSTTQTTTSATSRTTTSQPSTLINILSQQIVRPMTNPNTVRRQPPLINILSQQVMRPSQSIPPKVTVNSTSTTTTTTESSQVKTSATTEPTILNSTIKTTNSIVKAPTTVTTGQGGTILQFICKSSLPKFQQAFGKPVYQNSTEGTDSPTTAVEVTSANTDNKKTTVTTKTVPVNVQPIQGSVIYSRQVPVGQTISLIPPGGTTRQVFRIATSNPEQLSLVKDSVIHSKMSALLAAALQGRPKNADGEIQVNCEEIKGTVTRPTLVQGARIVKPVQLQLPSVVRANPQQPNMSSTTLEQLREFDMVYKQIKERSTTSTSETSTSPGESQEAVPQRISVTYVNQLQKYTQLSPVVVVSSYNNLQPAASPALSVTSQGSSSPCVTPASTPTLPKIATKNSKGKTLKTTPNNTATKSSPIPKPQQKPQEDEHTTQRIFDILAEYAEQLRNSPDLNNKPAPRRRSNPPTNPSQNSKRKKSSSGVKKSGQSSSTLEMDTDDITIGSEDSSGGGVVQLSVTDDEQSQASASVNTTESSDNPSPTNSRPILLAEGTCTSQSRNVIFADSVGEALKIPNTAVIVPGSYIMPVSMVKGGQQIAVVSGGSKILATVPARSGQNMLLFQSFTNQNRKGSISTVKYSTLQPITGLTSQALAGVSQQPVILPSNSVATAVALGQPLTLKKIGDDRESSELLLTISQPKDEPKESNEIPQPDSSTSGSSDSVDIKIEDSTSQSDSSSEKIYQTYQKTVINSVETSVIATTSTVKQEEAGSTPTIINVAPATNVKGEAKSGERMQSVLVTACSSNGPMLSHTTPRYRKASETTRTRTSEIPAIKEEFLHNGEKPTSEQKTFRNATYYVNKAKKAAIESQKLDPEMQKQAAMERELRLQKSLSEECEDLGVDEPSASDLFPEADLLFDSNHSPSFDQTSQDGIKAEVIEIKEEVKEAMNLFSDDENSGSLRADLFEYVEYQPVETALVYQSRQMNGNAAESGSSGCEDNTLLPKCAAMSEVTLNSPISPEMYQEANMHKYKFKYSNRKRGERIKQSEYSGEVVTSSEDTVVCTELGKTNCDGENYKVVHVMDLVKDDDKCELHCDEDIDSPSGRGARRSVRKLCSCCNGSQNGNLAKKRPHTSRPHTPATPHKKAFLNKKR